ncbi:hypothetical protein MTR67_035249 [Solanum verrucosum]|uniref:Uncharacterized protein n=1 Tax=Solanum verrucosum TaxID=315347 RepID=A0AAF0UA57_SOLVR|nr:hypothetical protein MTR67_035249 [Solanum verrucosum]
MVSMLCWNVRGLNALNKQKEVLLLCNKEKVGLIGLVETKVKSQNMEKVVKKMFAGWQFLTNLESHYNGRILLVWSVWRPDYYKVEFVERSAQILTCKVCHTPLQLTFGVSIVYAYNTREERRVWEVTLSLGRKLPNFKTIDEEEKVKHDKYRYTSYMAERFLQQQSKATWLKLGDD